MDELQGLKQQLEEARDEAELNLLQLQQVQEELEFYFLRCQELEQSTTSQAAAAEVQSPALETLQEERDAALAQRTQTQAELERLQGQRDEDQQLLRTAQTMLEGQARYLEDVSLREERAAQAIDRLRLLEAEILHYLRNSKPMPSLDPGRIKRLIELSKQPEAITARD
jgi:DNA repair exonuclease SbcCD ATPase subunit